MKKRILLLITLLVSLFFINGVSAADKENEKLKVDNKNYMSSSNYELYINPLYKDIITEDDIPKKPENYYFSEKTFATDSVSNFNEAAKFVRNNFKNREENIYVTFTSDTDISNLSQTLFDAALEHTGVANEGDYLRWQWGLHYRSGYCNKNYSTGKYLCSASYTEMTYYTTKAQEDWMDTQVPKVIASLNLTGTNYDKMNKIYNYIIGHVTYDYDHYYNDSSYKLQYTAYQALHDGTSVCQGYSLLLYRMALTAGIDARIVAGKGNGGNHSWNIVKLGKYYYNVDSTWDANYYEWGYRAEKGNLPYYLRNMANFTDHVRNSGEVSSWLNYQSEEFNKKHPMSEYDYANQPDKEEELKNGLIYNNDTKKWTYYKNGKPDYTYTGVAKNEKGTWYVDKGVVTFKHDELVYYNKAWRAFVKSKLTPTYTGILSNSKGDWYVKNGAVQFKFNGTYKDSEGNIYIIKEGKVDTTKTTIEKVNNTWYYFKKGKTDFKYTGVASNKNGTWYVNKGIVTFKHNELIYYNKAWRPFVNSKLTPTHTGILSNSKGNWYVKNGTVQFSYNGTYKDSEGNIYIIKEGKVDTTQTTIEKVNNTWYYFKKGKTDFTYTGVAKNKNGTWYVNKGIVTFKHNELVQYNGKWVAFVNSELTPKYTGILSNSKGKWYIKNGAVQFNYNGTYKDSTGKVYTIKAGKVVA